ncbi:MAG: hypothetical protein WD845_03555, partial [Pirellulales bacterium]
QFQVRHLLGLITGAAVLFAVVGPVIREADREKQFAASRKTAIGVGAAAGLMVLLLNKRHRSERAAGPVIQRFERLSSRLLSWLIAAVIWIGYVATIWWQWRIGQLPSRFEPVPGSPILLFFAVNYFVVRVWWQIDPAGIEACERGLILDGFNFYSWQEIARYSWSGSPPRQLNLFLNRPLVLNLQTDTSFVGELDRILAARIGAKE